MSGINGDGASASSSPTASDNAEPPAEEMPERRWTAALPTSEAQESAARAASTLAATASLPPGRDEAPEGAAPAPPALEAVTAPTGPAIGTATAFAGPGNTPDTPGAAGAAEAVVEGTGRQTKTPDGSDRGQGSGGVGPGSDAHGKAPPRDGDDGEEDGGGSDPVFSQQLWEVQLLLDYLSGNSTRRLPDKAAAAAAGLKEDWIEQICRITWPPSGSDATQADQEALLIRVKDYLNSMAAPANGASVAFTILVAQDEGDERGRGRLPSRRPDAGKLAGMSRSRRSLARKAYPDLSGKSAGFRVGMAIIGVAVFVWLIVTCWFTWCLALGNVEVGQLAVAQARLADLQVKVAAQTTRPLAAAATSPPAPGGGEVSLTAGRGAQPPLQATSPAASGATQPGVVYCDEPALLQPVVASDGRHLTVYASPVQADLCASLEHAGKAVAASEADLAAWLPFSAGDRDATRQAARASAWISTLANSVLPIFYGLLGAAAAVLRLLSRRVRLSLLTPRDMTLALQQLALGAVVGACIGLFVATPGGDATASSELFGTAKLSGSALSFVAGFGVDAVFSALEALITRLFATAPQASR